jgi:UDP-N-acetylmuramate dehydrogenase
MFDIEKFLLENHFKYIKDYPLGKMTTFGVGGKAKFIAFIEDVKKLKGIFKKIREENLNYFILGRGANLLVSDNGFNGIVIKLEGEFRKITFRKSEVYCGAGALTSRVSLCSIFKGFWGFENFLDLPGTIGGALIMNAGCYGKEISENLIWVDLLEENGNIKRLKREEVDFSYRSSGLKGKGIIIKAKFKLQKGEMKEIFKKAIEILKKRKENIPSGLSAGSIFKNPKDYKAKELIKDAGVSKFKIGGAFFSEKHPNIIINEGGAKAEDIYNLIKIAKEKVFEKFKINLEEEIIYVGF